MMNEFVKIDQYLKERFDDSIAELSWFCAQPSIAAQNLGMRESAQMVSDMLKKRGFNTQTMETGGLPVVVAERSGKRIDRTILFYNHYDVQPPEPLDLWDSPPFEPTMRNGKLYARGVNDDKGHLVSRLFAIDALLKTDGELPCNVKFIVEGEEEIGSVHLPEFIKRHKALLAADACIWEFGGVDHREVPMQYLGMRGICYVELSIQTASVDVHSGIGGSIFPNAAWRLVWALSSLKDSNEHICIPGFYDSVELPSERDKALINLLPDLADEYKTRYGVARFLHDLSGGLELAMTGVFEPTCTICGLSSGYQGAGSKTVLPAKASAKIDFRLALGQTIPQVLAQLRAHLDFEGYPDVVIDFLGGGPAAKTDPDDPFVQLVIKTATEIYDAPMEIVPMLGGSGPSYPFIHVLGLPVASSGVSHPGANAHAPNENMRLDLYHKGVKHITRILKAFSES